MDIVISVVLAYGVLCVAMPDDQTVSHTVTYPEVKDPQKHFPEKNMASPRKAAVLSFNPDGSLCIPADLKDKLANQDLKSTPHKS